MRTHHEADNYPVAVRCPLCNQCRNLRGTGAFSSTVDWDGMNGTSRWKKSFGCAAVASLPSSAGLPPSLYLSSLHRRHRTHALSARRPICPNNDSDSDPIMCGRGGGEEGEGESEGERALPSSLLPAFHGLRFSVSLPG